MAVTIKPRLTLTVLWQRFPKTVKKLLIRPKPISFVETSISTKEVTKRLLRITRKPFESDHTTLGPTTIAGSPTIT